MFFSTDDFQMVYRNVLEVYKRAGIETSVREDLEDAIDHGVLVTKTVRLLCETLGLTEEFRQNVCVAAGVHDIGKLSLGDMLYGRNKGGMQITELHYMRMHATTGRDMLAACEYPETVLQAVYHHHENYDGSGYPDNLVGTKIPLSARILKVCDSFCALISERPYREAFDTDTALEMMIEDSKDLDMGIFLEFIKLYHSEQFREIQEYAEFANAKKHYLHGA